MNFGSYFKDLRKSKGKTQEDLAASIGKTKMLISGVETGRNSGFSDEDIEKIVVALNLSDEESQTLRFEASQARERIPSEMMDYLFNHKDLFFMINQMACRQIGGNKLNNIIKYAEEILNA